MLGQAILNGFAVARGKKKKNNPKTLLYYVSMDKRLIDIYSTAHSSLK